MAIYKTGYYDPENYYNDQIVACPLGRHIVTTMHKHNLLKVKHNQENIVDHSDVRNIV